MVQVGNHRARLKLAVGEHPLVENFKSFFPKTKIPAEAAEEAPKVGSARSTTSRTGDKPSAKEA
jgi:hypothetical protein